MTPAAIDSTHMETERSIRERAIDATRHVAHVSHEAHLWSSQDLVDRR